MAILDIRKQSGQEVDVIQFADTTATAATGLFKCNGYAMLGQAYMPAGDIATKTDAKNLIKALEKAIELGWWK